MKNLFKIFLVITTLFVMNGCSDDDDKLSYPDCLNDKIDDIMQGTPNNPRVVIDKYLYNGQIVYAVNRHFPDYPVLIVSVIDENCEGICSMGGVVGQGCSDWDSAQFIETVWTDPR